MATEKVKVLKIDTNPAQTSVKELRTQLKELKDTLLSCEQGTEQYNDALKQAAEIQHTLKEQMEQVNAVAMDTGQILSNCTKAIGGMVAGFQAAKAVMNLFGVENEDVLKSLQKMQSLMALTQSFSGIEAGIKAFKRLGMQIKVATANTIRPPRHTDGISTRNDTRISTNPIIMTGNAIRYSALSSCLFFSSTSRLIASRFSSALLSYTSVMIFSPDRSSFTVISRISHRSSMIPESGMDLPVSHFETALSLMPSFSARAACVMPCSFLRDAMNFPILI